VRPRHAVGGACAEDGWPRHTCVVGVSAPVAADICPANTMVSNAAIVARGLIGITVSSPTDLSIIEVCELAALLLNFRSDPALGELIVSLRDPEKYGPTTLELDLAWKFQGAGRR
jgi:hypothetical protein